MDELARRYEDVEIDCVYRLLEGNGAVLKRGRDERNRDRGARREAAYGFQQRRAALTAKTTSSMPSRQVHRNQDAGCHRRPSVPERASHVALMSPSNARYGHHLGTAVAVAVAGSAGNRMRSPSLRNRSEGARSSSRLRARARQTSSPSLTSGDLEVGPPGRAQAPRRATRWPLVWVAVSRPVEVDDDRQVLSISRLPERRTDGRQPRTSHARPSARPHQF